MTARAEHESAFQGLVGHTVLGVVYMGAWSTTPDEPGAYVEWVQLTMGDSTVFRVTTEPDFGDYGVVVLEGAVAPGSPLAVFDAKAMPQWAGVLGRRVIAASVLWRPLAYEPAGVTGEPPEFPREAMLTFEGGGTLVLSAAAVDHNGEWVLGADSVTAFGEAQARELGLVRGAGGGSGPST